MIISVVCVQQIAMTDKGKESETEESIKNYSKRRCCMKLEKKLSQSKCDSQLDWAGLLRCGPKATRGHCSLWKAIGWACPVFPRAARPYQVLTGSQCFSVDSCMSVQVKLRRKVDDRVQQRRCGSDHRPVWSSVMGNWTKAASHKLMEINVCAECVRTPGQGRHLTAVKELRCIGWGGGGGFLKMSFCSGASAVMWQSFSVV